MWSRPSWDVPQYRALKEAYQTFFYHTLPEWCATEDPDRPYWPSSPSSGIPFVEPNGEERGNMHYWEVWHGGKPISAYCDVHPRFVSEFGFQSLPALETISTFAEESEWNMTSYIMEYHQRSPKGNGRIIAAMADHYRLPKDFESLVYLTQVLQAEAIRTGVEHWRRNRHRTSGTLYWQLNDCWPVASWSSLDYYGRWKALHYMARRFYGPLQNITRLNQWLTRSLTAAERVFDLAIDDYAAAYRLVSRAQPKRKLLKVADELKRVFCAP